MEQSGSTAEHFAYAYAQTIENGNISEIVAQFAEVFLAAGPQGAQCVRASDFAVALPKRKELFNNLGCRSTALISVEEIRLDARYVLARTRWCMSFVPAHSNPQDVLVDSDYIVDTATESGKIVLYLANQDIMAILKERRIMP